MSRHHVRDLAELVDQDGERPNSKARRGMRRRRADGSPFQDPPDPPDPEPDPSPQEHDDDAR
jgi:hypothetical protein